MPYPGEFNNGDGRTPWPFWGSDPSQYMERQQQEWEPRVNRTDTFEVDGKRRNRCSEVCQCTVCQNCANIVNKFLQKTFYRIGWTVGRWAVLFIIGSFMVAAALGSGALMLDMEERPEVLWLPAGSVGERDAELARLYFPASFRLENVLISAENILKPQVIKQIYELDQKLKAVNEGEENLDWEALCVRIGTKCGSRSILELWNFDKSTIESLTEASILDAVNNIRTSPYFGGNFDARTILGGVLTDDAGNILEASATWMNWLIIRNDTLVDGESIWRNRALDFEQGMLDVLQGGHNDLVYYYYLERSYNDEFADRGTSEALLLLAIGYALMTNFVVLVIGKFNRLEQRFFLASGGLLAIGLSLIIAMGLGTYMGFFYGPIQNILALLLLGIGIDDIFVITHALDRLPPEVRYRSSAAKQVALAMRHGGVSITVTSLTDFTAFAVGASTILPALRSFCVYCSIGLIFMYVLQITFFTACLAIDRWRVIRNRDACCPCIQLDPDYEPTECSQKSLLSWFFKRVYTRMVTNIFFKTAVLIISPGLLAIGIYGSLKLEVKTDFILLFPKGTYPREYLDFFIVQFPDSGMSSNIFFSGSVDYFGDYDKLDKLHVDLERDHFIHNGSVSSWYIEYRQWLRGSTQVNLNGNGLPMTKDIFYDQLKIFISSDGLRYGSDINFAEESNKIASSRINLMHTNTNGGDPQTQIKLLDSIRNITSNSGMGEGNCFAYVETYTQIEVDKVLAGETLRNLGLAIACVAVVTLFLLANIFTCLFVLMSVILTLIYVTGGMYFVDISVDIVSSLTLILSIGLSVDYATHVAHGFMRATGTRNERVVTSLQDIGGPVFLGGFSTFLAILPLGFASSFILRSFFNIFAAMVMFGLFNGLALLPVILSLVGPSPYSSLEEDELSFTSGLDQGRLDHRYDREHDAPEPQIMRRNHIKHNGGYMDRWKHGSHYPDTNNNTNKRGHKSKLMYVSTFFGRAVPVYNQRIISGVQSYLQPQPSPRRDLTRHHEAQRDYNRQHEAPRDYNRQHEVPRDYNRHHEAPRDYNRQNEAPRYPRREERWHERY